MNAAMLRLRLRQALPSLAAPVVAVLLAAALCGVILAVSGHDPFSAYGEMFSFGTTEGSLLVAANKAVPLYLSAMAVAIGFKMGLFNIGVEGQYSVAIVVAAAAGAQVNLFPPLHVTFIIVVAMLSGAAWATIPAVLKVTRNVSEVISTIMMNAIAAGTVAFLVNRWRDTSETQLIKTKEIPESGWVGNIAQVSGAEKLSAFVLKVVRGLSGLTPKVTRESTGGSGRRGPGTGNHRQSPVRSRTAHRRSGPWRRRFQPGRFPAPG